MNRNFNSKINEDWDLSNEGNTILEVEAVIINSLNLYKRGTLQRQVETINIARRLKRRYQSIYKQSIGNGGNRPNRNRNGVNWSVENEHKPYTIEEMILMSKIALHKRAPQESVTDLAMQCNRTPWAMTAKISQLRKDEEWRKWLEVERKQLARV